MIVSPKVYVQSSCLTEFRMTEYLECGVSVKTEKFRSFRLDNNNHSAYPYVIGVPPVPSTMAKRQQGKFIQQICLLSALFDYVDSSYLNADGGRHANDF